MIIWSVRALVTRQSQLGSTKIRIILNIALILHYVSYVQDRDLKISVICRFSAMILRLFL